MDETFHKLQTVLEDLSIEYDSLSKVMKLEREFLIQADLERLQESNQLKESVIWKIRELDRDRLKFCQELGNSIDLKNPEPRLLELSSQLLALKRKKESDILRAIHKELSEQMQLVATQNKENEIYAEQGLKVVQGAMANVKDYFSGQKTYQRKGQLAETSERSGNFVHREA